MPYSETNTTQQNSATGVLRSVATITAQRDRDLMAKTLVNTLTKLTHSKRITMYRILLTDKGQEAILLAEAFYHPDNKIPFTEVSIEISSRADFSSVFNSGIESLKQLDKQTFLSVYPIASQNGIVGLLEIVSAAHNDNNNHLIQAFLKVYSNYLTLLEESETDSLTGLLNRRTFDNNIEKIISAYPAVEDSQAGATPQQQSRRVASVGVPHWLAMIDIDHFKDINDRFGHLYGDEVLILLSRNMQRIFRQRDKLYRFGGEEFAVVLDRTSLKNAKSVLERFREEIENYHFPQLGKVTISIGFVKFDKADVSSSIIGHADQALYYAKQHGRNQVRLYEDLIAEGKLSGAHYSDDMQMF